VNLNLSNNMNTTLTHDLGPAELRRLLDAGEPLQLVDVREEPEFAAARLVGAQLIPLGEIERRVAELDHSRPLVLVCRSGKRSDRAREKLAQLGFTNIACLSGGLTAWETAGLPVEKDERAPWALERQVRIAAGALVVLGVTLGFLVHPGFFGSSAFVGVGLVFAGVTDWCGMGLLLAKAPWNRRQPSACRI
jgi:rhodanese-related sulfurtransferase